MERKIQMRRETGIGETRESEKKKVEIRGKWNGGRSGKGEKKEKNRSHKK